MYVHRVVWKIVTGQDPNVIDHINGDGTDNRWENLRSVTIAQNTLNRSLSSNNRSGVSGVCSVDGRWRATIRGGRNKIILGEYKTFEEAVAARKIAEEKYGYVVR